MTQRWTRRPEGSNWGDFGPDDQLGSLNLMTAETLRRAVATVREGRAFCLSLPLDYPGGRVLAPHRFPPVLRSTERHGKRYFNFRFSEVAPVLCEVGCDDAVTLSTQYSTQWDSFAHIGHEFDLDGDGVNELCFYNGFAGGREIRAPEERGPDWAQPLGIDTFAARPIQGRGVLVDLDRHFGRAKRDVGLADLEWAMAADGAAVEPGDVLCLHTGFADELLGMNREPDPARVHDMCCALDGHDAALLDWITRSGVAAIAADNYAVERVGPNAATALRTYLPLHVHCLFKRGIPLGELWHMTELAGWLRDNRRTSFLLTAPPLRLPGAVGSPVTPVATV